MSEAAPATGGTDDGEAAEEAGRATGTGDGEGSDRLPEAAARGPGAPGPDGGAVNGAPSRGRRRGADAVPPTPEEPAGASAGPEPEPRVTTGAVATGSVLRCTGAADPTALVREAERGAGVGEGVTPRGAAVRCTDGGSSPSAR
ncbi:hypothetical protein AB0D88_04750 [Streptomyces werraensis]|uniref:hypothetical protein n=1 Tax=Streptomyces werraensis TaxID=68284 RepID=UPI00341A2FF5